MLGKLLKYEIKHSARYTAAIYIATLAFAAISVIALIANSTWLGVMSCFMLYIAGFASVIVTLVSVIKNFYDTLYGRQGYLTFTLPVKRSELFLSKMLTAVIYNFASFLVTLISMIIIMAIAPANVYGEGVMLVEAFKVIGNALEIVFTSGISGAIFILALIAALIHGIAFSPMVIYTAVTIGCVLVKKLKVLASIGIYYASTIIISIITSILTWGANMILANMGGLSSAYDTYAVLLMVIIVMMMLTVGTVLLYRFNLSRIEKNLNLA
jgi:hypothetical protein